MMITVGIVNYNYGRFLDEAIASAKGAEIIVIDDCSTDDSVAIAEAHEDVRVIRHERNSGSPVQAWNEILEAAKGEYVIFLSADDLLMPNTIETIEKTADERGGDWIFGDLLVIDENGAPLDEWVYANWPTEPVSALARGLRTKSIPVTMVAAFRTEWLRENGCQAVDFDGMKVAGDTATCVRWLTKWPAIRRVPDVLFKYRKHSGQQTEELNEQRAELAQSMNALYLELFDTPTLNLFVTLV